VNFGRDVSITDALEVALSLEELTAAEIRARGFCLRDTVTARRRVAMAIFIAEALRLSSLSAAEQTDHLCAWCDGLGINVSDVRAAVPPLASHRQRRLF
jgi:hypothetical protein